MDCMVQYKTLKSKQTRMIVSDNNEILAEFYKMGGGGSDTF